MTNLLDLVCYLTIIMYIYHFTPTLINLMELAASQQSMCADQIADKWATNKVCN